MTSATGASATARPGATAARGSAATTSAGRPRDVRLDFFRGIGMFIIFIAHVPDNAWKLWIPARFGWSDATEIFVFCSGMASAIAFGKVFSERGLAMGTARTVFRVWQVYWAHVCLFLAMVLLVLGLDHLRGGAQYVGAYGIAPFLEDPARGLPRLMTLTFQPPLFDILPMYLVILAMMPVVITLALRSVPLAAALSLALWFAANLGLTELPADWWSDRAWTFNPFGWQLVFFSGFFLMARWLPAPPIRRDLVVAAIVVVVVSVPPASIHFARLFPVLFDVWEAVTPLRDKSEVGILRYVHFLALAYLAYAAAGEGGRRLLFDGAGRVAVDVCRKVGQQALPVFMMGILLAVVAGAALDAAGRTALTVALANLAGCVLLVGVAYGAAFFKAHPWRRPPAGAPAGAPAIRPAPAE